MYPEERKIDKKHIVDSIKWTITAVGYLGVGLMLLIILFGGNINLTVEEGLLIKLFKMFV